MFVAFSVSLLEKIASNPKRGSYDGPFVFETLCIPSARFSAY